MVYETSTPAAGRANEPSGLGDDTLGASASMSTDDMGTPPRGKTTGEDLSRRASRKAEQIRTSAAEGLDSAASAMQTGGARVAGAAQRAGEALASGADYVRAHDARDMMDDLKEIIRSNPGPALLAAAALGFIVGRAVYRN
jgi:ElaB/YqjD/DUF883 family membrane-anchored ribosome-binding protein